MPTTARRNQELGVSPQGRVWASAETTLKPASSLESPHAKGDHWAAGGRARRTWQAPPHSRARIADPRERDTTGSVRQAPSCKIPARMPLEVSRNCRATLVHRAVMAQLAPILQLAND